jgi:hypothetical protein
VEPRWVDFAAAADTVYYFVANLSIISRLSGVGLDATLELQQGSLNFVQVSEEEGKRRMKGSPLSVWRLKK